MDIHQFSQPFGSLPQSPYSFASQGQPGILGSQPGQHSNTPFGNSGFGQQAGPTFGTAGSSFQPPFTDAASAAYVQQLQQAQLAQLQAQLAQQQLPLQLLSPQLATLGSFGRYPPSLPDPALALYAQQAQLSQLPQLSQLTQPNLLPQLAQLTQPNLLPQLSQLTQPNLLPQLAQLTQPHLPPQLAQLIQPNLLPQLAQLAQLTQPTQQFSPPGFQGSQPGLSTQPFGPTSNFGSLTQGTPSLQFGSTAQPTRHLPFATDPLAAAYAQQLQQLQQAQLSQQLQQLQQAQLAQQLQQLQQLQQAQLAQQFAPQGFFGNPLTQLGQPFGNAIGSIFGNPALGAASQFGRYSPFGATPTPSASLVH